MRPRSAAASELRQHSFERPALASGPFVTSERAEENAHGSWLVYRICVDRVRIARLGYGAVRSVDEVNRIRGLLEVYESALGEIRRLADPGLDELEARLEARAAAAAHDYFDLLRERGSITFEGSWPSARRTKTGLSPT